MDGQKAGPHIAPAFEIHGGGDRYHLHVSLGQSDISFSA
jgi:hypothetical protein